MKKITLNLDALNVETFDTLPDAGSALKGTVHGNETNVYAECATAAGTGCCTQADDVGCSGDPGCGGIGTANCGSEQCTWMPGWQCMTNPIAYPTICNDCPLTSYQC